MQRKNILRIKENVQCNSCETNYKDFENKHELYLCSSCIGIAEGRLEWYRNVWVRDTGDEES